MRQAFFGSEGKQQFCPARKIYWLATRCAPARTVAREEDPDLTQASVSDDWLESVSRDP